MTAPTPARPLATDVALAARLAGSPLVILLDVDGTLAPIAPRPEDAAVPERTRAAVERLVGRPGVHVALVSGRAARDALRMVDIAGVWAIGNHGVETIAPDGTATVDPRVAPFELPMRRAGVALERVAARAPGAFLEDKRWTLSLHYRLADPGLVPTLRAAAEQEAAAAGLVVTEGKAVFELRPPVAVDKGTATVAFVERMGALAPDASVLFAGDDVTDEDAFRALRAAKPEVVTVRVDPTGHPTTAELTLGTPDDVRGLLEWLAQAHV